MCVLPSSAPCCPSPTPVVRQSIFLSLGYGARCVNSFSPVHLDSFFSILMFISASALMSCVWWCVCVCVCVCVRARAHVLARVCAASPCEISAVCVACSPLLMCVPRSSAPCCPSPPHVILQIIFVARLPRALRKIVLARPSWFLLSIPMLMSARVHWCRVCRACVCACVLVFLRVCLLVFAWEYLVLLFQNPKYPPPIYICVYMYVHIYTYIYISLNQVINPTSLVPLARTCLGAYAYPSRSFFYPQVWGCKKQRKTTKRP